MLTFEVPLVRIRNGMRVAFTDQAPPPRVRSISPSAKTLALAYRIVKAVEHGEVRDFSAAALRMGVSQARVSMVVSLIFLAPEIQADVLLGVGRRIGHKRLLQLARMESWEAQLAAVDAANTRQRISGRKSPKRNLPPESGPILAQKPLESRAESTQASVNDDLEDAEAPTETAS